MILYSPFFFFLASYLSVSLSLFLCSTSPVLNTYRVPLTRFFSNLPFLILLFISSAPERSPVLEENQTNIIILIHYTAHTHVMPARYKALLRGAEALCNDFASQADLQTILSHFNTHSDTNDGPAVAFEHGDPRFAPFLGRALDVKEYFQLLQKYISYSDMSFSNYFVDATKDKVSVNGTARFVWLSTGVSWSEVFTYVLDFVDDENETPKVSKYHVWADTGALYLARIGQHIKDIPNPSHTEGTP
ncbi:hypothetical protein TWF694_003965 [Orbilia ellipsospora]|uniref:SnoaL-like domain-containing protein n=1 Tax=Orbilia ellipsospora TaxID=2528407 RepID=A0AAV9WXQ0_9PEZI